VRSSPPGLHLTYGSAESGRQAAIAAEVAAKIARIRAQVEQQQRNARSWLGASAKDRTLTR
jgi:hypothetical protein